MEETLTLNFDGGSRGNPGTAGIGVVLRAEDGTPIVTIGRYIGRATNNFAEYMALIVGLREAAKLGAKKLVIRGDSELIIKQMKGEYRVKNPALRDLYDQAQALIRDFDSAKFEHNLRHHNSLADKLANKAMDQRADVQEIDEIDESSAMASDQSSAPAQTGRRACRRCGSVIAIEKPCPRSGKPFLCPCGGEMQ